jgi:hypothetical protein
MGNHRAIIIQDPGLRKEGIDFIYLAIFPAAPAVRSTRK